MNDPTQLSIYQLRAVLNGVSPLVWRRFLLSSETSLADLHKILQLAFGWSGFYLYEFCIHGKTFGSNAEDPRSVCLGDFQQRPAERFRYRYNFMAFWESDLRLEATVPLYEDLDLSALCGRQASCARRGRRWRMGLPAPARPLQVAAFGSTVGARRNHAKRVQEWQSCRDRLGGARRGNRSSRSILAVS